MTNVGLSGLELSAIRTLVLPQPERMTEDIKSTAINPAVVFTLSYRLCTFICPPNVQVKLRGAWLRRQLQERRAPRQLQPVVRFRPCISFLPCQCRRRELVFRRFFPRCLLLPDRISDTPKISSEKCQPPPETAQDKKPPTTLLGNFWSLTFPRSRLSPISPVLTLYVFREPNAQVKLRALNEKEASRQLQPVVRQQISVSLSNALKYTHLRNGIVRFRS